jgi:hypothetical protein
MVLLNLSSVATRICEICVYNGEYIAYKKKDTLYLCFLIKRCKRLSIVSSLQTRTTGGLGCSSYCRRGPATLLLWLSEARLGREFNLLIQLIWQLKNLLSVLLLIPRLYLFEIGHCLRSFYVREIDYF